ncbi:MAG: selenocysteine-specific translation elongation factor [Deltaproteobacteria bacterium CG2_30_63_29]|nr:MAG: selenocysteine-specific translation elongation factor [Deltaproteobacteria bacterium CG2_30_63_29]PJB49210.1 MAG: selenocysteine-specific translation elongation factor [Deltaproteobacteria bacterium CG_4_9_14_3_um_filter_63_12]
MILGTAGHIDHGKTTLVEAITGINPDRLKEEKERGITIELGFAHLDLDGERLGVVDVPGHERFVRHMVAGAGGIDLIMMIIAADEGVMPQTREHLEICQLMGVTQGFVVLTKTDLVEEEWVAMVEDDVRSELEGTFLEGCTVVPFSAMVEGSAQNVIAALRTELKTARQALQSSSRLNVPRLPIDRVFTVKGFGTVVTGTLLGGRFEVGEEVELIPGGTRSKVRTLQVHGEEMEKVGPGSRTAINLAGVGRDEVRRGQVVAPPNRVLETRCFDASLQVLEHVEGGVADRASVLLHTLTQHVVARVVVLADELVAPGEMAYVQLRTEEPVAVISGDHFVLRGFENVRDHGRTLAGGRVLDPDSPHFRQRHRAPHLARLEALDSPDASVAVAKRVEEAGLAGITREEIAIRVPFAIPTTHSALDGLGGAGSVMKVAEVPGRVFSRAVLDDAERRLVEALEAYHREHPDENGMQKEQGRGVLSQASPKLYDVLLESLVQQKKVARDAELIRLESFIPPKDDALDAAIEEAYRKAGWAGFAIEELEVPLGRNRTLIRAAGRRLLDLHVLVKVKPDFFMLQSELDRLRGVLDAHFKAADELAIPELRELTGLSRKHLIPLVEYLDRLSWTRRNGDLRTRGPSL